MTLTNHNGTFKKCAISSISVAISMLFYFAWGTGGNLGIYHSMENLYSTYLIMGLILLLVKISCLFLDMS